QATHMPCLQEVFAGRCHDRVMTPSLDAVVSTATPESHGGKRIERVLTSLLLARNCIRRPDSKRTCPISRAFYGRYWARTSDPQLVEVGRPFAPVRARAVIAANRRFPRSWCSRRANASERWLRTLRTQPGAPG